MYFYTNMWNCGCNFSGLSRGNWGAGGQIFQF